MQDTNLKISPYFDDFDRSKNYQKVLFKPGYSVQTRELNSLQTMMQNQIERFGEHIFKDGSVVIPGNVTYKLDYKAVLVQSLINGLPVENNRQNLIGKTLLGATSGVKAQVTDTIGAAESEKDTITLYVKYSGGGTIQADGTQISEFLDNEVLIELDTNEAVAITTVENASAYTGSVAYLNAGVYFIRGFFVEVATQRILLEQYSNKPSYKVGLQVTESIITSEEDETLFDNSLGTTNYASPGADRLKIDATLTKQDIFISETADFIELLRLEEGELTQIVENSVYNELAKNLARRTFDESGSYTKSPYTIKVREALRKDGNNGVYNINEVLADGRTIVDSVTDSSPENSFNGNDYYAVEVSEGKGYIKGYEVVNQKKQYVIVPKPRRSSAVNNQGLILNIGSYLKLDNSQTIQGLVDFDDDLVLRDADNNVIGTARAIGLTGVYRLYLTDINMKVTLTMSGAPNFIAGDFVTGTVSGATAFVESVVSSTVVLRQVTGQFLIGDSINASRPLPQGNTLQTISQIDSPKLENIRKVTTSGGFEALINLDAVKISGSSFVVSGGTSLTGVGTQFLSEVSAKSKLRLGTTEVEVGVATSSTVVLSSSVTNGNYASVSKLICKLYSSENGLTYPVSDRRLSGTSDFVHSELLTSTVTTVGDVATISTDIGDIIDVNSIVVTTSTGRLTFTPVQDSSLAHIVNLTALTDSSNNLVSNGTTVNIYFRSELAAPAARRKTKKVFQSLLVDKQAGTAETSTESQVYGRRFTDKEISLKFPDVFKVHAIHQAVKAATASTGMFDRVVLNDTANVELGDIFAAGNVQARVIGISGTTLYVKYLTSRLQSGSNLTIPVTFLDNSSVIGRFVSESVYGNYVDVTDDYILERNDTANYYRTSKLRRKDSSAVPADKLVVIFDYFEHSSLSNDFYTVESYVNMRYEDIPLTYNKLSPSDSIDFRLYSSPSSTTGTDGTIATPFIETKTNSPFDYIYDTYQSGAKVPYPSGSFRLDYAYYLGRVDKVYLTPSGEAKVEQSSDAINPELNTNDSIGLHLGTIKLKPYLKDITEASVTLEKTRGYTMRDIGKLEERLSGVEQYASLSLLESNTINMNILDEEGRNRFKNGFVVDSFKTTSIADLENIDYDASIDLDKNTLRPYPFVNNIGFRYSESESDTQSSSNYSFPIRCGILTPEYVTVPYEEVDYITQPYATRVENLTPFLVTSWIGEMELSPKKDIWYDTQRTIVEGQSIDLVEPYRTLFDIAVPGGEIWGDWELGAGGSVRGGGGTSITDIRNGTSFDITDLSFDIESGDTIQSITDIRFTRSRVVDIRVDGLKPSTKMYFTVNEEKYDNICYPKLLKLKSKVGNFVIGETVTLTPIYDDPQVALFVPPLEAIVIDPLIYESQTEINNITSASDVVAVLALGEVTSPNGTDINPPFIGDKFTVYGNTSNATATVTDTTITTNSIGELDAFVLIPELTFETGDVTFSVTDREDGVQIKGLTSSYASNIYYAQGTQLDVTSTITSIDVPEVTSSAIQDSRTRFIPDPPPPPPPAPAGGGGGGGDPLAQTFNVTTPGGIFVTSIDLFFLSKDERIPVTVDIRTVENGIPTANRVPGAISTLGASSVNVSNDGTVATTFKFRYPVYLSEKNEYAFVAKSASTNYYCWVSRLSEEDISTGFSVDQQPAVGVLLKSANDSTWISDQFEDIKFTLRRAKFETNKTFTAILNNSPTPPVTLNKNPFKFTQNSATVSVFQPNHCMHDDQNNVRFYGVKSDVNPGFLNATIVSTSVSDIVLKDIDGQVLTPFGSWTTLNGQPVSEQNRGYLKIGEEIISYTGVSGNAFTGISRGALNTTAVQHAANERVECYNINGIRLDYFNKIHTISKVIDFDNYEIIVATGANVSKQNGGAGIIATRNIQFENLYPKFNAFTPSDTSFDISVRTISATSLGSTQQSFAVVGSETVNNYVENELDSPRMILSEPNRVTYTANANASLQTTLSLSTSKDTLSPLVDIMGSSITTISNRISKQVDNNGNLDISSELLPSGGKHSAYITRKVVLENSSTSVKVLFDAIRRADCDIKVFVKIKGDTNYGIFKDMNYVEVPALSYPTSATEKELRAFDFEIKGLPEFKEFSVKIIMIGNNQSIIPTIKNVRSLALAI